MESKSGGHERHPNIIDVPGAGPLSLLGDRKAPALVFDACQIGVVLRAVLFVELAMAVAAMFAAVTLWDWVMHFSSNHRVEPCLPRWPGCCRPA